MDEWVKAAMDLLECSQRALEKCKQEEFSNEPVSITAGEGEVDGKKFELLIVLKPIER